MSPSTHQSADTIMLKMLLQDASSVGLENDGLRFLLRYHMLGSCHLSLSLSPLSLVNPFIHLSLVEAASQTLLHAHCCIAVGIHSLPNALAAIAAE